MGDVEGISTIVSLINPAGIVYGITVIVLVFVSTKFVNRFLDGLGERMSDRRLLFQQLSSLFGFGAILFAVFYSLFAAFHWTKEAVTIVSGGLGVALGLSLQDLVKAVIAGITLLFDRPFQVGDRVSVGSTYGDVVSIGLRSVRIVTLDDNLVTIPNNTFMNEAVASGHAGENNMLVQMDFYIDVHEDLDAAVALAEECLTTSRYIYLHKPWAVLANQVVLRDLVTYRLRLKAYVLETKYEKPFSSDVTRKLMRVFKEQGIRAPRVHQMNQVVSVRSEDLSE